MQCCQQQCVRTELSQFLLPYFEKVLINNTFMGCRIEDGIQVNPVSALPLLNPEVKLYRTKNIQRGISVLFSPEILSIL